MTYAENCYSTERRNLSSVLDRDIAATLPTGTWNVYSEIEFPAGEWDRSLVGIVRNGVMGWV